MNSRAPTNIVYSSLVAGMVWWFATFSSYLWSSISNKMIPLDALLILIPVLIIALCGGIFLCLPIYYFLKKRSAPQDIIIILTAGVVALILTFPFTHDVYGLLVSIFSGALSGVIFTRLEKSGVCGK